MGLVCACQNQLWVTDENNSINPNLFRRTEEEVISTWHLGQTFNGRPLVGGIEGGIKGESRSRRVSSLDMSADGRFPLTQRHE